MVTAQYRVELGAIHEGTSVMHGERVSLLGEGLAVTWLSGYELEFCHVVRCVSVTWPLSSDSNGS